VSRTGNGDRFVLDLVKESGKPLILVLNKIDKVKDKALLLPLIEDYSKEYNFAEYQFRCRRTGSGARYIFSHRS
jgi:GTP-binding protein Era